MKHTILKSYYLHTFKIKLNKYLKALYFITEMVLRVDILIPDRKPLFELSEIPRKSGCIMGQNWTKHNFVENFTMVFKKLCRNMHDSMAYIRIISSFSPNSIREHLQ